MKTRQIEHEVFIDTKSAFALVKKSLPDHAKLWWFHAGRWRGPRLPEPVRHKGIKGNMWNLRLLKQWCVKHGFAKFTEL